MNRNQILLSSCKKEGRKSRREREITSGRDRRLYQIQFITLQTTKFSPKLSHYSLYKPPKSKPQKHSSLVADSQPSDLLLSAKSRRPINTSANGSDRGRRFSAGRQSGVLQRERRAPDAVRTLSRRRQEGRPLRRPRRLHSHLQVSQRELILLSCLSGQRENEGK